MHVHADFTNLRGGILADRLFDLAGIGPVGNDRCRNVAA